MAESQREYRVGLVGYRVRGRMLAEFWEGLEGARLVAVTDLVPEHLADAREEHPGIETYADHKSMLDQANLDVLTISPGPRFRPPIVHDAAGKVRGIYMEKPIANSLAEADTMIAECRAGGTVLTIGHQRRWYNHARWVRQAIKDGAIGRPTHGYVSWPTGRILTEGIHDFDGVNFYLDDRPVEVVGTVDYASSPKTEDVHPYWVQYTQSFDPGARGFITYANGARIAIDAMNNVLKPSSFILCGSRGRIEVAEVRAGAADAVRGGLSDSVQRGPRRVPNVPILGHIDYRARDVDTPDLGENAPVTKREPPHLPPNIPGAAEQEGFRELLDCIETGAPLSSSGEDGRQALEIVVAFHMSAKAGGKPVSLPLSGSALSYKLRHQGET